MAPTKQPVTIIFCGFPFCFFCLPRFLINPYARSSAERRTMQVLIMTWSESSNELALVMPRPSSMDEMRSESASFAAQPKVWIKYFMQGILAFDG